MHWEWKDYEWICLRRGHVNIHFNNTDTDTDDIKLTINIWWKKEFSGRCNTSWKTDNAVTGKSRAIGY